MSRPVQVIRDMYVTSMPVILGGVSNMIFTKTPLYQNHRTPIDGGKLWRDGKRILGDNKTWIGFASMTALTAASQVCWGAWCSLRGLNARHDLYRVRENTLALNLVTGTLYGLSYAVCELPNSFVKRRFDIRPGKTEGGAVGKVFFAVDQIDSLLGVFLVLKAYAGISWARYLQFICLGFGTHVGVNYALLKLHIRKNL